MGSSAILRRWGGIVRNSATNRMMSTVSGSPEPPWLQLPPSIDGSGRLAYKFHRVVAEEEEEFSCQSKMEFPEDIDITKDVDFAGSSHGWLALFNRRNYHLYLSNPITDSHIQLPPLPVPRPRTFGGGGVVERVILSSSPDQKACQSFMTIGGKAALCLPRRSSEWTFFPGDRVYDDLVYSSTHSRLFCVTRGSAVLEGWDTSDESSPRLDWAIQDKKELDFGGQKRLSFHWPRLCMFKQNCDQVNYVVCDEHSGDLFVVVRHVNVRAGPYNNTMVNKVAISEFGGLHYIKDPYKTVDFDVFKVDWKGGEVMYMEDSLEGLAMFVGTNHSMAIPAKEVPGLKPDSIYFTDEIRLVGPTRRVKINYGGHDNEFIPQPRLSEVELAQVEAAFALEDRSWIAISKGQRVCAMGKFNLKDDKDCFKAAARSKKKEAGKCTSLTSKRKEPAVEPYKEPKQSKKARIDSSPVEVGPSKKGPSSSSVVVGLAAEGAASAELPKGGEFEPLKLKEFPSEASKTFLKSSFDGSTSSNSSWDTLQLSFHRMVSGLYAQSDAMLSLDSIEEPLKERIADLESQLKEAEAKFEKVNEVYVKMKASNSELRDALTRFEDARQEMSAEIKEKREMFELEFKKLQDRVLELQGLVARQCEEIEKLKVGEGLDLEAFIDSEAFVSIKDSIEDATGDELIRRIKEVHPDIDLSFLTMVEPSASPNQDIERGAEGVEPSASPNQDVERGAEGVEPKAADEGGSA